MPEEQCHSVRFPWFHPAALPDLLGAVAQLRLVRPPQNLENRLVDDPLSAGCLSLSVGGG